MAPPHGIIAPTMPKPADTNATPAVQPLLPDLPRPAPWPRLILGSTSVYRRELLARLRLPFDVQAPEVDETPHPGEAPQALASRLARAKADAVAAGLTDDVIVIGADQVANLKGQCLGKPGHLAGARAQLQAMRGQQLVFHTALCVLRPRTGHVALRVVDVTVQLRALSDAEIDAYLMLEQPFDCAGSAKVEALGISLLHAVHSDDPTALVGLPLIATHQMLADAGLPVLQALAALAANR
jgi:septum formation protein